VSIVRQDQLVVSITGARDTVALSGELDGLTVCMLDHLWSGAVPVGPRAVIDVSGLTFVDSRGLNGLVRLRRRLLDGGSRQVVLRSPRDNVRHVLALTGLDAVFAIED
jgi:anti-sigma B factor antagonist